MSGVDGMVGLGVRCELRDKEELEGGKVEEWRDGVCGSGRRGRIQGGSEVALRREIRRFEGDLILTGDLWGEEREGGVAGAGVEQGNEEDEEVEDRRA